MDSLIEVGAMTDQAAKLRNMVTSDGKKDNARVIAITSGKGGVGKTNLAVNLAIGLQMAGKKTLLIDADVGMANVNVLIGSVTNRSILDLAADGIEVDDIIEDGVGGVKYISGVASIEATLETNVDNQKKIHAKLANCADIADFVIIDTGAGLNRYVIDFILAAHEVLLVTTPEPTAMADAYAIIKAYGKYSKNRRLKLVVNRVLDDSESKNVAEKLNQTTQKFLKMPISYLGYVYEDRAVIEAVRRQEPFLLLKPDAPASRCIKELVRSLVTGEEMQNVSKGWRSFIDKLLGK